jgi:hypothetical protein
LAKIGGGGEQRRLPRFVPHLLIYWDPVQ